jgi:hypothetical protein
MTIELSFSSKSLKEHLVHIYIQWWASYFYKVTELLYFRLLKETSYFEFVTHFS